MFEGSRLDYIVPGYTGYPVDNVATYPRRFIRTLSESGNKNLAMRYQVYVE
jgi:hypothetical protein